jgi:hypothetical protein
MQIKTSLRFFLTPVRMAASSTQTANVVKDVRKKECKLVQQLRKTLWRVLKNTRNRTPRDIFKGMLSQVTTKAPATHVYCNIHNS